MDVFKMTVRGKASRCWYGKVQDPLTKAWVRVSLNVTDKAVARRLLQERQRKAERVAAGMGAEADARPAADHLGDYCAWLRVKRRTEKHVAESASVLRKVIDFCRGRLPDLASVERYLAGLAVSARTFNKHRGHVVSFFQYLLKVKAVPHNPMLALTRLESRPTRRRRALTAEEVRRLVAAARERPLPRYRKAGMNRAMTYLVAFHTGLRRGEIYALKVEHLDLGEVPSVRLPAPETKSRKEAHLPLSPALAEALRSWVVSEGKRPGDRLFDAVDTPSAMKAYRMDLQAAGIDYVDASGRVADFHALRVSFATHLRLAGVDIGVAQRLLRHADIRLTMNVYTDGSLLDLRGAVEKLPAVV